MTREEARSLLDSDAEVSSVDLGEIFEAFGFCSEFEAPNITIYVHEDYVNCGSYRDKEYIGRVLGIGQRMLVAGMIECIKYSEIGRYGHELQGPPN